MDNCCMITNSRSSRCSGKVVNGGGRVKDKRITTAVVSTTTRRTLQLTMCIFLLYLLSDLSQTTAAAVATDGHGGRDINGEGGSHGGSSGSGGGDNGRSSSTPRQHSSHHQSAPSDSNSLGGVGDNDESSSSSSSSSSAEEDAFSTMLGGDIVGQRIYLVIVGIVLGTWIMYMICTCRTKRIQKKAFEHKVELMKQEVVLDCENKNNNNNHNNHNHNNNNNTNTHAATDMIDTIIAPFDTSGSSLSLSSKQQQQQQQLCSPVNGRYESTYMKPWETCKSHVYMTFSTRHDDGGKGWIIDGTGVDHEGSFNIIEGLVSESGKAYWIEKKCDNDEMSRSSGRGGGSGSSSSLALPGVLSVTSGTFHLPFMRDCSNTCFNGSWHADNGTRGIYWSFRMANNSDDNDNKDEVFANIDLEHDD
jgi:uncharacterized membrane protein YgcG